jgi:hypothetical protein
MNKSLERFVTVNQIWIHKFDTQLKHYESQTFTISYKLLYNKELLLLHFPT